MDKYIACANVDHYLSILNGTDLSPHNRSTVTKLLVEEEDRLGHDLAQLEFAETRAAKCLAQVNHFRNLRGAFAEGSDDRARADRMLANFEAIHELVDQFCHHLRLKVCSSRL